MASADGCRHNRYSTAKSVKENRGIGLERVCKAPDNRSLKSEPARIAGQNSCRRSPRPVPETKDREVLAGSRLPFSTTASQASPITTEGSIVTVKHRAITSDSIFTLAELSELLGLRPNSLPREVRKGRLRVSKICGRYLTTGAWIKQWLESGEVRRRKPTEADAANIN
jgi:hypothetical protein